MGPGARGPGPGGLGLRGPRRQGPGLGPGGPGPSCLGARAPGPGPSAWVWGPEGWGVMFSSEVFAGLSIPYSYAASGAQSCAQMLFFFEEVALNDLLFWCTVVSGSFSFHQSAPCLHSISNWHILKAHVHFTKGGINTG